MRTGVRSETIRRTQPGNVSPERYFGKFLGIVAKVAITDGTIFVKAIVPSMGPKWVTEWAPVQWESAGYSHDEEDNKGRWGRFSTPQVGSRVVIEFLNGDLRLPIVTGYYYAKGKLPTEAINFEYLEGLPYGGTGKRTAYASPDSEKCEDRGDKPSTWKETIVDNAAHPENYDREKLDGLGCKRLSTVELLKTPAGFFFIIHDDQGHIRLHTPKRSYLLLDDKREQDQTVDMCMGRKVGSGGDKEEDVHDEAGFLSFAVLHSEDKIELVEDASHNVPFGDHILRKYNIHHHYRWPGGGGRPYPQWDCKTDLSHTVYVRTAEGQDPLKLMDRIGQLLQNDPAAAEAKEAGQTSQDFLNDLVNGVQQSLKLGAETALRQGLSGEEWFSKLLGGADFVKDLGLGLAGIGFDPKGLLDSLTRVDLVSSVMDFTGSLIEDLKGKALSVAKAAAFDAIGSVVPIEVIAKTTNVLNPLLRGDWKGTLDGLLKVGLSAIPGADTAKALIGMAAPFTLNFLGK